MNKILFALFCSIILSVVCQNSYQKIKVYDNPNKFDKIAFSPDETIIALYSQDSEGIIFMNTIDVTSSTLIIADSDATFPNYVELFNDANKQLFFIRCSDDGKVYTLKIDPPGNQALSKTFDFPINRATVSFDATYYAAISPSQTKVFVGQIAKIDGDVVQAQFNANIRNIKWHPTTNSILVILVSSQNKQTLVLYDVVKKQHTDLTEHTIGQIQDAEFSADGKYIAVVYLDIHQEENGEFIYIYNSETFENDTLIAPEATQIISIKTHGKMLTAYDSNSAYAWQFNGVNYGKYQSSLKSSGLSPTAGTLLTQDANDKTITINKICKSTQIFINADLTCQNCKNPCLSCIGQAAKCSSCLDQFYFVKADYSCKNCSQNCQKCTGPAVCDKCLDAFYKENNVCKSCATDLAGCIQCSNGTVCEVCDDKNNWQPKEDKCECKSRFVQQLNICQPCPNGCFKCSTHQECNTCDITKHRSLTPVQGKCLCATSYFQNADLVCQSCILGCLTCADSAQCSICDSKYNWVLKEDICVCNEGYIQKQKICFSCASLMQGCSKCNSPSSCSDCIEGYSLNTDTKQCIKEQDGSISLPVIIIMGVAVLIGLGVGSFFLVKMIRRRREKKMATLLQSEGGQELQHD